MGKKKKNQENNAPQLDSSAADNGKMGKYSVKTSSKKINKREALIIRFFGLASKPTNSRQSTE